ncbi:MAG TPA: cupin domain-containing protein [Thermodesulfobacteriota bacterium]|nr:cupin domain-containing protein [Thermodesulfobacteriota bacterium]
MAEILKPIRRIVTGHDRKGRSCVLYDGRAPNVNPQPNKPGSGMTDIWVFPSCPVDLSGDRDDGNLPFNFEPPPLGGHLRIVQSPGKPSGYDPRKDPSAVAPHPSRVGAGGTEYRGGANFFRSPTHRSKTVDYGIVLEGERILELDSTEIVLGPGDTVVQLGNWHAWSNPQSDSLMAFIMMGATFDDALTKTIEIGKIEKKERTKSVRYIVTGQDENEKPVVLFDGLTPNLTTDPARPGYVDARIWSTDHTPARIKGVMDTLSLPNTLEPPPNGSVFRVVTFPPDEVYMRKVGPNEVHAFFESVGSPHASTFSGDALHPYRQRTMTLDFCIVLEGEITLILDTAEVNLKKGDVVVQRGTNHAWSNRSDRPCVMVISQHDGKFGG